MRRVAALSLILAATCGRPIPKYSFKLPELHAKLDNGMRVIVLPDETTELVQVDVRYEVGANEDPPGKEGLAHLVEHLMFQQHTAGEDKPPLGALLRKLSIGYNAYTTNDTTHYMTFAKKEHFEDLISLEATRMFTGCQGIPQTTFEREREVVRNEMRWRVGNPDGAVYYQLLADIFPEGHPYRREVGGDDDSVSSITLEDVCKFMSDYYVPERATVVVAGNVSEDGARKVIGQWMTAIPKKKPAPRAVVPEFELKRKRIDHDLDIEETMVVVAWRLPRQFTDEYEAASFALSVVGRAASFGQRYEIATQVRPGLLGGALAPVFYVAMYLRDDKYVDEAIDFIFKGARSAHRSFEEDESFEEYRKQSLGSLAMSFESLGARTGLFADYAQFAPEAGFFKGEMSRIKRIDGDRVRAAVKRTLDPDRALISVFHAKKGGEGKYRRASVEYEGANVKENREKFDVDPQEAYESVAVPPSSTALSRATTFKLGNGMRVMLLPTKTSLPVVTTSLVFDVGSAHEPKDKAGLASVAARFLSVAPDAGAGGQLDSTDVFGKVGAERFTQVGADSTIFAARGLNVYLEVMVKGLERLIVAGDYSQDALERWQESIRLMMRRKSAASQVELEKNTLVAVYGADHPYATTGVLTPATASRIGRDAAYDFKRTHYSAKNATLVIAGNFDPVAAKRAIRDNFGGWSGGRDDEPVKAAAAAHAGPTFIGVAGEESATATLRVLYPGPAGEDAQTATRLVLAEMLNLRMSDLREKLGSSYGAGAGFRTRVGPGMYTMTGPVDAARAGESLVAMRQGVDSLRKGEDFAADFVRARRLVLEELLAKATDSLTLAMQLSSLASLDLPLDHYDTLVRRVANLAPEEVMLLISKELKPEAEVVLVHGPVDAVKKAFADAGIHNPKLVE